MIKTKKLITMVEFGQSDKASIAVGAKELTLTLQMLATEKNIGEKVDDGDIKDLPRIEMFFHNDESIDVVINALQHLKKYYNANGFQLAKCC